MSPEEQVVELTGLVSAVVNGVESVTTVDGAVRIETRLPKAVFARMVEVSE